MRPNSCGEWNPFPVGGLLAVWLILLAAGCGSPPDQRDARLAEFARESVDQQARQNEALARQSEAVISESREVTVAARELVEKDAEARREMVAAQRELQQQLLQQHAEVDNQRDLLEAERRRLAQQRGRDPIIAAAIQGFAGLLACLLPLLLCFLLLYRMNSGSDDEEALSELLVQELTSDQPRLLPPSAVGDTRRLAASPDSPARSLSCVSQDADTDDEPPF